MAEHLTNVSYNARVKQDNEVQQHQLMASYSALTHAALDALLPGPVLQPRANSFDIHNQMLDLLPFYPSENVNVGGSTIFVPPDNPFQLVLNPWLQTANVSKTS